MLETQALIAATAVMAILMGLAGWFDLKALRIPNWCVLGVVALYVVTGLWGMPFYLFLWHFLYGVIALVLGFGLYSISGGQVGGGDIKLIAALTPFIAGPDVLFVLGIFAILSLIGLMLHRFVRGMLRDRKTGWAALDQKRFFPAGLLLGGTIMIYLGSQLAERFSS
jgi:prepilin peptidase CpaA